MNISVSFKGLEELEAKLKKLTPEAHRRLASDALRPSAEAIAQEGNRRIHSPRGHARTFRAWVKQNESHVTPGSRANFFSQRYKPVLQATVNAVRSRLDNISHDAVERAVDTVVR